jgi:serine/threonine protein kinase
MSGEIIGGYRVVRRLGQGGMGTVFEAVDTMLERQVALKVLRSEFAGEPELAERFQCADVPFPKRVDGERAAVHREFREFGDSEVVERIFEAKGRLIHAAL